MTIPSTRTAEDGHIAVDHERCTGCGLCVAGCPDKSLCLKDGKAAPSATPVFGCFACGHCMAVCPCDAVAVTGRTLSPADIFPLPVDAQSADYAHLLALMQRRRSVRAFTDAPVSEEHIEKIVQAAQAAPMGIPPSEVHLLVLASREKVRGLSEDVCSLIGGMKVMASDWALALLRPFMGKEKHGTFRHFIKPLMHTYLDHMERGEDAIMYGAPLALYFYGSPYSGSDPLIAATYAMLAGEALGLGSCMIGGVHPFLQVGKAGERIRNKYGIKYKSKDGLVVVFGHAKVRMGKGIHRTLAEMRRA